MIHSLKKIVAIDLYFIKYFFAFALVPYTWKLMQLETDRFNGESSTRFILGLLFTFKIQHLLVLLVW